MERLTVRNGPNRLVGAIELAVSRHHPARGEIAGKV
jgi:hypothetical protein